MRPVLELRNDWTNQKLSVDGIAVEQENVRSTEVPIYEPSMPPEFEGSLLASLVAGGQLMLGNIRTGANPENY